MSWSRAPQLLRVVRLCLKAEDVFAFGRGLEGQLADMELEHRQVIHRCLDHNLQAWGFRPADVAGARFGAEDRLEAAHVEVGARPVNHTLEDLLHLSAHPEQ